MLFSQNRDQIRNFYCEVWRKHEDGATLEPLEVQIRDVILQHPEYQQILINGDAARGREYLPEMGETNPFLHMGMHLAIQEQLATDRPSGILALYRQLLDSYGDPHELEHRMMDCLGESLWQAQRNHTAPDEAEYLNCLRALLS